MQASTNVIFFRFSPENMSEDTLRQLLTGKEKFLEQLVSEIAKSVANKTPRYLLIVGPRGIGKSHIMMLLYYEIKKQLSTQLIPIKFAEEEYSIFRASDLFLRALEERPFDTTQIRSLKDENLILDAAVEQLKLLAKKENKHYIFFIENLHIVFGQLEKNELQTLRSIYQKNKIFSVVASAPITFEGISEHDEPFYNFFKVTHLDELTLEETKELMKKIAALEQNILFVEEFANYEKKIEGIYHLTGGSPRLVMLLYEIITRGDFENLERIFLKMMDEHTPYYQEIFQMLSPQRRLILDTLMTSPTPLTPKDIAQNSRVDEKTVYQQLRRLETDGYLLSHPMGKRTSYEVRERLFRLWRDMRKPLGKNRISIFIDFLTCWYTPEEREGQFKAKFELLLAGDKNLIKEVYYFAESLPPECRVRHLHKYAEKLTELGATCEVYYTIKHLKSCVNQIHDEKLKSSIYTEDGKLRFEKKEYEKALKSFEEALQLNPDDVDSLCQKCIALNILDRYDEALKTINKVLEIDPNNAFALRLKASVLGPSERYEEALESINKSISIEPKNPHGYYIQGLALKSLDRFEESLKSLDKSLEIDPNDDNAMELKGEILGDLRRYDEAIEIFDKILIKNQRNADVLYLKSITLGLSNKFKDALETINQALEIRPNERNFLSQKSHILLSLEEYEKTIMVEDEVLKLEPDNLWSLNRKGIALNCLRKFDKALEIFNRSLEVEPNDPFILYLKSLSLNNLGECEEALKTIKKSIELEPNKIEYLNCKTEILKILGMTEEAMKTIEDALKIFPDHPDLLQEKMSILFDIDEYEKAIEISDNLIKIEPNNQKALQIKSFALSVLGQQKEALEVINRSLDVDPNDIISIFIKSVLLNSFGRYDEALDTIDKALKSEQNIIFINRKIEYLLKLKKFDQVIDTVKNSQNNPNYYKYSNEFSLALIEVYNALGKNSLSLEEIEKLRNTLKDSDSVVVMEFTRLSFDLAFAELKLGNQENGKKLIKIIYDIEKKYADKELDIKTLTIDFLKKLIEFGDVQIIELAINQVIACKEETYRWFIKPLTDALEIIKTGDIRMYFRDMQSEEREVVAEIVKKITKSDKLRPQNSVL